MRKRTASRLEFIPPQIPTLVDQPPEGEGWIHEVKFDGYRAQIIVENGEARVFTRNGHDWSTKFWPIALAGQALPCKSAIIDGEVIVCNDKDASDFNAIGRAIKAEPSRLCFVAFDLLHLDGRDLRSKPLVERRAKLADLVRDKPGKIQFSESFEGDAKAIFRVVDGMGLEGMVSKRADSRYKSGPSKSWLKAKCFVEADLEVLGVVREQGEAPLALLAAADGSRKYVGAAVIGLNRAMRERLRDRVAGMPGRAPRPSSGHFRSPFQLKQPIPLRRVAATGGVSLSVYNMRFAAPVFVRLLGVRHPSAVKSLGHAADLLFDNWPRADGPKYAEARRACLNCDGSDDSLAWTRHAFKEAAREAGILIEDS